MIVDCSHLSSAKVKTNLRYRLIFLHFLGLNITTCKAKPDSTSSNNANTSAINGITIAAIVIGTLLVVALIGVSAYVIMCRGKQVQSESTKKKVKTNFLIFPNKTEHA